jgi:hypothetical protein
MAPPVARLQSTEYPDVFIFIIDTDESNRLTETEARRVDAIHLKGRA